MVQFSALRQSLNQALKSSHPWVPIVLTSVLSSFWVMTGAFSSIDRIASQEPEGADPTWAQAETIPGSGVSDSVAPGSVAPSSVDPDALAYDPLALAAESPYEIKDLEVVDSDRERSIPLRIYLPEGTTPAPVILLSHGLGGSRLTLSYLANHWAARGYGVIALQHLGSDDAVWRSVEPDQRHKALTAAATVDNFLLRVNDIPAVLDQLERWSKDTQQTWVQQLELARIGMAGYSFGAITAQAIGGQRFLGRSLFQDDRVQAVVLLSPSSPLQGTPQQAFSTVTLPWLLMTGTADVSPIGNFDVASRLAVFSALPPGNKYELVLQDGEHSVFADGPFENDRYPRNPNHHRATIALSTAFWDAYLKQDKTALGWLTSQAPRQILEPNDRWQWDSP